MASTAVRTPSRNLRWTFLVRAIVAFVMAVPLLVPEAWGGGRRLAAVDPTITRALGAGILSVASWLGYRADAREELRLLVAFEIVFPAFVALAGLYEVPLADAPAFTWVVVAVTAVFAVASEYFYRRMTVDAAEAGERTAARPLARFRSERALPPE